MPNGDTLPRRNLPGESENWGRQLEGRLFEGEKSLLNSERFLKANNRSFASQFQALSNQLQRIQETNIYFTAVRSVSNVTGLNYTSAWSIPAPSWASSALVQATTISVGSTSISGSVAVSALHNSEPVFTPVSPTLQGSLSVILDNTTFPQVTSSYSAYAQGISGVLYNSLFYSRDTAGSGSASLTVGMTVTWLP